MRKKITIELPEHKFRLMLNNLDYGTELVIEKLDEAAQGSDEVRKAVKTIEAIYASLITRLMNVSGGLSGVDTSAITQRSEVIGTKGMQEALLVLTQSELDEEKAEEEAHEAE